MPKNVLYKNHFRTTSDVLSGSADDSGIPGRAAAREQGWRASLAQAYLLLAGVVACGYIITFARRRAPWPLGDWLINYSGGFVRRGLPGSCVHLATSLFHLSPITGAACLEALCVLGLILGLWPLVGQVFRPGGAVWEKALLFSPATLAFFWLDSSLILRKEIALFALLGLLVRLLLHRPAVSDVWLSVLLCVACPTLLLSHEGLVCYLPYLAALIALGLRGWVRMLKVCAVPGVLSAVAVAIAFVHPGNQQIADKICASVGGTGSGLCQGPIGYIGITSTQYASEVAGLFQDKRLVVVFLITGSLALLPALRGLLDLWKKPVSLSTRAVLPAAFVMSAVFSIVLFVQAQDWTRWIYIHIVCLMLVLFFAVSQREYDGADVPAPFVSTRPRQWVIAITLLLVIYATAWRLPEWILLGSRDYKPYGYSNLLLRVERHSGAAQGNR